MRFACEVGALTIMPTDKKLVVLSTFLESLTATNQVFLRDRPATPTLYTSGVTYELMPWTWRDVPMLLMARTGDCKSLVAWRLAELRNAGEDGARCHFLVQKRKERTIFHVQVKRADGKIEDPSARVGMKRSNTRTWLTF